MMVRLFLTGREDLLSRGNALDFAVSDRHQLVPRPSIDGVDVTPSAPSRDIAAKVLLVPLVQGLGAFLGFRATEVCVVSSESANVIPIQRYDNLALRIGAVRVVAHTYATRSIHVQLQVSCAIGLPAVGADHGAIAV